MQQYVTVNSKDRDVQNMEDSVLRVFTSLYSNPLLNGPTIIKSQRILTGVDNTVFHKLLRPVLGFLVINIDAPAIVYQSSSKNIAPTTQILLKSNADVTVDILFF